MRGGDFPRPTAQIYPAPYPRDGCFSRCGATATPPSVNGERGGSMSTFMAPFAAHASRGAPLVTPTGDQAIVMADTHNTHGSLTVIELTNQPKNGPPLHSHVTDDEVWYVLEG